MNHAIHAHLLRSAAAWRKEADAWFKLARYNRSIVTLRGAQKYAAYACQCVDEAARYRMRNEQVKQ